MTQRSIPHVRVVRWVARILATLVAILILAFFVGEGIQDGFEGIRTMNTREWTMMVAFLAVWAGLIVGWRRELLGGGMTVVGFVAFYLLDYAFSGTFPRGPYFALFASPSLLYLYCGLRDRPGPDAERAGPEP